MRRKGLRDSTGPADVLSFFWGATTLNPRELPAFYSNSRKSA